MKVICGMAFLTSIINALNFAVDADASMPPWYWYMAAVGWAGMAVFFWRCFDVVEK